MQKINGDFVPKHEPITSAHDAEKEFMDVLVLWAGGNIESARHTTLQYLTITSCEISLYAHGVREEIIEKTRAEYESRGFGVRIIPNRQIVSVFFKQPPIPKRSTYPKQIIIYTT